jgi:hypothetical protein
MDTQQQTFASHARWDPAFHFFVLPVGLITVIVTVVDLFRAPGWASGWLVVVALAAFLLALRVRSYATKLQDRVIRLEERIRLTSILQEPLRSRVGELTSTQLIGLRFASDAELPALVKRALNEKLDRKAIKQAITNWRPDTFRV